MRFLPLLLVLLAVPAAAQSPRPPRAPGAVLDSLALAVTRAASRPVVYTDKGSGVLYLEAAGPQTTGWQGYSERGTPFVDDWAWTVGRTRRTAQDLTAARVRPDAVERRYDGGLRETVTLLDAPAHAVVLVPRGTRPAAFEPLVSDSREASAFEVRADGDVLLIARRAALTRPADTSAEAPPRWLAVSARGARAEGRSALVETGGVDGALFAPGRLVLRGDSPVALALGHTPEEAAARARAAARDFEPLRRARAARMEALLAESFVRTEDTRFNRAFAWARLSLDALVMHQHGPGIFAGLPWFNNYWGRDSFISLAGTALATGRWEEAATLLESFARFQDTDPNSPSYGRIPNQVSNNGVSYNTADGTPWFVLQADALRRRWADDGFRERLWPVVQRATDAALRRTDREGFLLHGDQETWMDASAGPGHEWSPRGNRAVEIQGLWYEQLRAAEAWFQTMGYRAGTHGYGSRADDLRRAFERRFRDPRTGAYYDHLDEDGTPDHQVRPNVFFALHSFGLDSTSADVTRALAAQTVYPWGVASLAQADPNFHPYHEAPEYYPKDAAYHNGTIWTWLTGPLVKLITAQGAPDVAYDQTRFLTDMALDRGAVGTMAENTDALPREGQALPRLTGTVSQAWTLAEYVRSAYEDYAGVHYDAPDRLVLAPQLPSDWGTTTIRTRFGDGYVTATLRRGADAQGALLNAPTQWVEAALRGEGALPVGGKVEVRALGGVKRIPVNALPATVRLTLESNGAYVVSNALVDGTVQGIDGRYTRPDSAAWRGFAWQAPRSLEGLRALAGPGWSLLPRADVKVPPPASARTRLALSLPSGDDRGPSGTYTYPAHPAFAPGILDATGLTIREDETRWYFDLEFRALTQPGWNPQLGFQLTMAALAFSAGEGTSEVGREARYRVEGGLRHVVYVGAGLRVEDTFGNVLGEYRPAPGDERDPLGSPATRRITFSLPKTMLPAMPSGTRVTLLVGAQDDHGGQGIGDFRAVSPERSEWTGGGLPYTGAPNVYDVARGVLE